MNPILEAKMFEVNRYYKVAEIHTNSCDRCKATLIEDFLKRWEHMTGKVADRRGSAIDRAQRLGLTAGKAVEEHTDHCDFCFSMSLDDFEARYIHSKAVKENDLK